MGKDGKYFTSIMNITSDFALQVKASHNAENTLDLLNDAYRFLFSHNQAISLSAMHTYYSALPFTPHNTRLYHLYEQETSDSITVLQGLRPTWTSCLSSLSIGGYDSAALGISQDGMQLAVSQYKKITILDARTTAPQCQISLTDNIFCLAFSPCESTLATVTSKSLELWNTTTGLNQKTQTLSGAQFYEMPFSLILSGGQFDEVAFSSQGQYLLLSRDQGLHLHHGTEAGELSVLSTKLHHTSIIFASNDTQVITGSKEGYIHFFTLSGNQLSEIQERRIFNGSGVWGLVLRHDGKRLASSGEDGTIRIYDLPSQSRIATLRRPEGDSHIRAIAYHPTEEELAVGDGRCVVLWRQEETPSNWVSSIHSNDTWPITRIAYCQSGARMYTGTRMGDVKLWTTTVTRIQEPPKHAGIVAHCAVNQPTSLLATGGMDKSIILWNFTTGDYWKTLLGHTGSIGSLSFSDDGVLLASGSDDRTTIVWDVASSSRLHKLGPHDSCGYGVLAFSEDNARLTTRTNNECFLWELKSGELLEQRDRDMSVDEDYPTPYRLKGFGGWQVVVSASQRKGCKYGLCGPPGEYEVHDNGPILGDRAALLCVDGRVVILDISRVVHVHMDPAQQLEWRGY